MTALFLPSFIMHIYIYIMWEYPPYIHAKASNIYLRNHRPHCGTVYCAGRRLESTREKGD